MCKELSLNRTEIEESLKKTLYNNIMATYLLLARHGGNYNNRVLSNEVLNFKFISLPNTIHQVTLIFVYEFFLFSKLNIYMHLYFYIHTYIRKDKFNLVI